MAVGEGRNGMSGNVGASMEFTARVGSILRGLLPRCWITESGSQRLGGLFECLLQEAAVPAPTFYGATLSCVLEIVSASAYISCLESARCDSGQTILHYPLSLSLCRPETNISKGSSGVYL